MQKISARKVNQTDHQNLKSILDDAVIFKLSKNDEAWGTETWTDAEIDEVIELGNTYIVELDGKVLGCVDLIWEDSYNWGQALGSDNQAGYLHRLAVLSDYKGQGLGQKIISWAEDQVKSKNRQYLRLDCPRGNKPLCKYYENNGFKLMTLDNPKNQISAYYQKLV